MLKRFTFYFLISIALFRQLETTRKF